jgi:hypothetical protein
MVVADEAFALRNEKIAALVDGRLAAIDVQA